MLNTAGHFGLVLEPKKWEDQSQNNHTFPTPIFLKLNTSTLQNMDIFAPQIFLNIKEVYVAS